MGFDRRDAYEKRQAAKGIVPAKYRLDESLKEKVNELRDIGGFRSSSEALATLIKDADLKEYANRAA